MASYTTPLEFLSEAVDLPNKLKAGAIDGLVKYLCGLIEASPAVPEEETLRQWAINAEPNGYKKLGIKGVKIATFQWLRMLFGADTSKPDVHIMNFINDTIEQTLSKYECVLLIEGVASYLEVSEREVDGAIWNFMASGHTPRTIAERYVAGTTEADRDEVARKLVELRINATGSKPLAWRKIREKLGLHNDHFHKVIRVSDGYRKAVIDRIKSLRAQEGGWEYSRNLERLTGIELTEEELS